MTEQPIRFLRLQGIARDWSKHNEHSRNIFSVHGFLRLSVRGEFPPPLILPLYNKFNDFFSSVEHTSTRNFTLFHKYKWLIQS